ncbi:MAG TPA: hypothetical protein VID68_07825 [Solirubrobacteraceae bacterium]|jgi:hypothetical protein
MASDPPPFGRTSHRAVALRDAGLRRISATTRWVAAAVVALSGALALMAANAFHGHTATSTSSNSSVTQPPSSDAIQQPSQAPQAVVQQPQQQPVVVSGGS